ncbi:Mycothiol S-conjugate amidase [Corynebacterium heidelbergense]|uniref:mycothiol conjugate amidase Mca n=1 Tax=Corynebacterium heidelbergense TaxID=2055947 RepID=UPI002359A61C|nr:mycothiol conjugate amidase Mca [Corynebacterium heidelbergense]WCZ37068.1 Mycothiol S-conjugate amidase [Corynebacterium heidelbergense]
MADSKAHPPTPGPFRVLAIHAHPDDESSKGAATMARYVDEGHRVRVLTCTGGERGDILNPLMDKPGVVENMVAIRRREMAHAAEILGIEHTWLGYHDSGLPQGDPPPALPEGCFALADEDEVVEKVVREIRDYQPHVIITYDENGGYPHPDHIMVHKVSIRAWAQAADPQYAPELGEPWAAAKLYYSHGFVRPKFQALADQMERRDPQVEDPQTKKALELLEFFRRMPDVYPRVTTRVPVAQWLPRRYAALRAHATQIDPDGPFFAVDVDTEAEVWPTEEYELAQSRVPVSAPDEGLESELFYGIPDSWDGIAQARCGVEASPRPHTYPEEQK